MWPQKAFRLRPNEGKYGYTYAFFLYQGGESKRAVAVLEGMVARRVPYGDAYALLGAIYLRQGEPERAIGVYRAAHTNEQLAPSERKAFGEMIRQFEQRQ